MAAHMPPRVPSRDGPPVHLAAKVSVARQPLFDASLQVTAWELLYRDAPDSAEARIEDGSVATARVAIGLPEAET